MNPTILSPGAIPRESSNLPRHFGVEVLEVRIAPAAVATPATFNYTDGNGDIVQVQITGASGTAEFLDSLGGDVAVTGGDIAEIILTKPSKDFAISFADTNAVSGIGMGDNVIALGAISGPLSARLPVIKGIFTADSTPAVEYHLGGFFGTDFSAGGGLGIVGLVVGDGVTATTDVDLKSLAKGTSIKISGIDAGATIAIPGKVAGAFSATNVDGDLLFGTVSGAVQIGHIGGTLTLQKDLSGRLVLGDPAVLPSPTLEEVTINGSVLASGVIDATQDLRLHVVKNLSGNVLVRGSLEADVTGGLIGASIVASDDLTLDITGVVSGSALVAQQGVKTGSVFKKGMTNSSIVGGTGLALDVTGSVTKSRFSGGIANLEVNISGKVSGSQFLAGGDAIVTTGFAVSGSSILPDGRLTLNIGQPPQGATAGVGDVSKSVIGSKSTSAVVNIGGKVVGSHFTTGTDLDLTVGKSLASSIVQSGNNLTLGVQTIVQGSRLAVGSDANVTIGAKLAASSLIVSNNLNATIGQAGLPLAQAKAVLAGIIHSRIETSDGSATLAVVGNVQGTVIDSGQNVLLNVADLTGLDPATNQLTLIKAGRLRADVFISAAGDVSATTTGLGNAQARIVAGHDVTVDVGAFGGAITAGGDLDLQATSVALAKLGGAVTGSPGLLQNPLLVPGGGGSVSIAAKPGLRVGGDLKFVVTGNVGAPLIDVAGNVNDFRVGGSLSAGVYVGGNFIAGTTAAAATVVGGTVSKSTFLQIGGNIGDAASAPALIFAKGFAGQFGVGGQVLTDLTFEGAVNRIAIGGQIGPAVPGGLLGDAVADIVVRGKLTSLTSASLFDRATPNGGNFLTAAGVTTGALQADAGAALVGPFLI